MDVTHRANESPSRLPDLIRSFSPNEQDTSTKALNAGSFCTVTKWVPKITFSGRSHFHAIAAALAKDIAAGVLKPGQKLPPHRELAHDLGVAVGTVSKAYAEARRRGYVASGTGSGTFVVEHPWSERRRLRPDARGDQQLDLSFNTPVLSDFHSRALKEALQRLRSKRDLLPFVDYQRPWIGSDRHRESGAAWLNSLGLAVNPMQVAVVSGAQHAASVVLLTRTEVGDLVVTDELTDPLTKLLVGTLGRNLLGLPMDGGGLIPDEFEAVCRAEAVKVLVCSPDQHSPTNILMPEERRRAIAAIARKFKVTIFENAVYRPLAEGAPPPLSVFAPENSYFASSFSKFAAPGLRLGFVAAPQGRAEDLTLGMGATSWLVPPLLAEIGAIWIEDGTAVQLTKLQRDELAARNIIANQNLSGEQFSSVRTGMHIWLRLPDPWHSSTFVAQARSRGILVAPAEAFATSRAAVPHAVRISVGGAVASRDELCSGLTGIAEILRGKIETSYLSV